jgi:transcriptional regulator with XRE-family HTH domain
MENKLRERVRQYCEYMNIRISQFEKKAGLSNGYFNQVSKKPSDAKLGAIAKAHPALSIEWLCTGHGEMLKGNSCPRELTQPEISAEEKPTAKDILIAELRTQIEKLEIKIDNLNQELGEKNAFIKLMRQGGSKSVHDADGSSSANVG